MSPQSEIRNRRREQPFPITEDAHAPTRTIRRPRAWQRNRGQARRLAHGPIGTADRGHRAQVGRRRLPQHRLHAEQERDPQRRGRASGPHRRAFRRDGRSGQGRHGQGRPAQARDGGSAGRDALAELQGERRRAHHGRRALRRAQNPRSEPQRREQAHARRRPAVPEPRNPRPDPGHSGPCGGEAADACRSARARRPAGPSDRDRRRLCRARTGAGLSPLRGRSDRPRGRAPAHGARGRRRLAGNPAPSRRRRA